MKQLQRSRDAEKDMVFFGMLAAGSSVAGACRAAGYARSTVYDWRKGDAAFRDAWAHAREEGTDLLEDEAIRRASVGLEKPVYYQGRQIGTTRDPSDRLLIFLLQARRPEIYRERLRNQQADAARPENIEDLAKQFDARIDRLLAGLG